MGIDFEYLCKKYGFVPTGIIHIGAHLMEERKNYLSMGVNNIIDLFKYAQSDNSFGNVMNG